MAKPVKRIDVSKMPELLRLAEEVAALGEPYIVANNDFDLAIISPLTPAMRRKAFRPKSEKDLAGFRAAAGSWKDMDIDKFLADLYESRKSSRPPVDL